MSWNHRLLAHKDGDDMYFMVHEVYYDKEGNPVSYTTNGVSIGGNDLEGVQWVINKMIESTKKPILSVENFPKEYVKE